MCTWKEPPPGTAMLSREHHGPRAVLNALDRLAGGYEPRCDTARQDLAIAEAQLRDYQARLGKPFPHDAYLAELTGLARPAQGRPFAGDARAGQRHRRPSPNWPSGSRP